MNEIARFEKVSFDQFYKDWNDAFYSGYSKEATQVIYDGIKLPERKTAGSAGYDFLLPIPITLPQNKTILMPTGIKCNIDEGWVLMLYPRSSLGFKYRVQLDNTTGIIDSDYYNNEQNEGHIMAKITNDSTTYTDCELDAGQGFIQGIFLSYGIIYEDSTVSTRVGGIGSTDNS